MTGSCRPKRRQPTHGCGRSVSTATPCWSALSTETASATRLNLTLNLGLPVTPSLGDALAKIRFARAHGVRRFSFFNYGFLGAGRLDWIARIAAAVSNTG